jgi:hypothetical protein
MSARRPRSENNAAGTVDSKAPSESGIANACRKRLHRASDFLK